PPSATLSLHDALPILVDDALRSGRRLIGMIQPDPAHPGPPDKPNLFKVGCVGRITQFAESGDGRYLIQLTGIVRFPIGEELEVRSEEPRLHSSHQITS